MGKYEVYFWKKIPLFRILVPFILGILLQWYIGFSLVSLLIFFLLSIIIVLPFYWLPTHINFSWRWLQGLAFIVMFVCAGALVTFYNDIRNNPEWINNHYVDSAPILVTIQEPIAEKNKSYKALATVEAINIANDWKPVKGKILLYFKKDSLPPGLVYGSQLVFSKPLQTITNSGNPGAFNYQRYSAFNEIYHQCFLKENEFIITGTYSINSFRKFLFDVRYSVVTTLRTYIKGEKERGVAEALLIGYRDDLDKDLVQAYSNTGVVHIIAISGLHLGMIYGSMLWMFRLFKKRRWVAWVKPIVILSVLWIFSLAAGAAPSIMRSAIMFTFLLTGEILNKKSTIYNTLAASALFLLCINPFVLWNVGFQLSYAAVLSIVVFMQPIYRSLYFKNKLFDGIWKLNAVTLSAQILTLPIVCFHFHQFPNLFLVTNFVVVPLASVILYSELAIVIIGNVFAPAATFLGEMVSRLLWTMNTFIEKVNSLSFVVTGNIQVTVIQTILLYLLLIAFSWWLLRKKRVAFFAGLGFLVLFMALRTFDFIEKTRQQKMIFYNIPQHTAVDFISGRDYQFVGDTALLEDGFLQNFHLKPSRILNRVSPGLVKEAAAAYPFLVFDKTKVLLIDKPYHFASETRIPVDVIVISKNPRVYISQLNKAFDCKLFVFDGSNPLWKINLWKKDCDSLHLRHYSTQEKGALELDL